MTGQGRRKFFIVMIKYNFKNMMVALGALAFLFTACKRNRITDDESDNTFAKDNASSEFFYNDALNIADQAAITLSGNNLDNYKTTSNCATVTHDTISVPHTITIDFGSVNCLCNDGRYRRGQVLVSYMGAYKDSGSVHTITFNNYYVNDNHVMGSKQVTNMGHNSSGHLYFNIMVNGQVIKAITQDTILWNQNRVRTYLQGDSTQTKLDDIYSITGSGSGQKANGTTYTMTITSPLIKDMSCDWIKQGSVEIQPNGGALRLLDFGNGTCDDQATITVNGVSHPITLN